MKLVWTRQASTDLIDLIDYIAPRNRTAAGRMLTQLYEAVNELLPATPYIGRVGRVAGTRELLITSTPYIIVYRVQPEAIEIIAVLHERRAYPAAG